MNQLNVPFCGAFFCLIILITHRTYGGMFVPKCDAKVQLIKLGGVTKCYKVISSLIFTALHIVCRFSPSLSAAAL